MLARAEPSYYLWIAQDLIDLNVGPRVIQQSGKLFVSHLFVNLPADLRLTPVMKSPYCPAT